MTKQDASQTTISSTAPDGFAAQWSETGGASEHQRAINARMAASPEAVPPGPDEAVQTEATSASFPDPPAPAASAERPYAAYLPLPSPTDASGRSIADPESDYLRGMAAAAIAAARAAGMRAGVVYVYAPMTLYRALVRLAEHNPDVHVLNLSTLWPSEARRLAHLGGPDRFEAHDRAIRSVIPRAAHAWRTIHESDVAVAADMNVPASPCVVITHTRAWAAAASQVWAGPVMSAVPDQALLAVDIIRLISQGVSDHTREGISIVSRSWADCLFDTVAYRDRSVFD